MMTRIEPSALPRTGVTGARALATLAAALLLGAGVARGGEWGAETGMTYSGWRGSDGSSGSQLQVPLRLFGGVGDFSASLLTAYAFDKADVRRAVDDSVNGLLDTKVGASYEVVGKLPVDVLVGLDLNLPTGRTRLSDDELRLAESLDAELVPVTSLGEGFNVNPTLTLAKTWGSVGVGLGLGYLWRGSYDPGANVQDLDPGDVGTLTGELRWAFAREWEARVLGRYARYGRDTRSGDDLFREGDFGSLLVGVVRSGDRWGAAATFQGIRRGKGEVLDAGHDLTTEDENSHGMEYRGTVSFRYSPTDATRLTAALGGLYVVANGYEDTESRYVGNRRKFSLALGGAQRFAPNLEARLGVSGFWMADGETNLPTHRDSTVYRGLTATASVLAAF